MVVSEPGLEVRGMAVSPLNKQTNHSNSLRRGQLSKSLLIVGNSLGCLSWSWEDSGGSFNKQPQNHWHLYCEILNQKPLRVVNDNSRESHFSLS